MNCIIKKLYRKLTQKQDNLAIPENAFLVDVRTAAEFAEGSVENAINIPLDQIEEELHQFDNKKNIVVFCKSGMRSERAKDILIEHGFSDTINGGGYQAVIDHLKK